MTQDDTNLLQCLTRLSYIYTLIKVYQYTLVLSEFRPMITCFVLFCANFAPSFQNYSETRPELRLLSRKRLVSSEKPSDFLTQKSFYGFAIFNAQLRNIFGETPSVNFFSSVCLQY